VGAQIAHPDALVIDIAGEASTLMNIQELGTIAQYRLPVKIFILNNQYMGMVRQWQELLHGSRYSESQRGAAGFHPSGRELPCQGHARDLRGRAGRRDPRHAGRARRGGGRYLRGAGRELLPHDPVRRGP
jgi:acetolactate synthase-1/2/3 large subunit